MLINNFDDMYKMITGCLKIGTTLDILQENALVKLMQSTDDTDCIVRTSNGDKAKTGDLFDIIGHNPIFIVKALDVFFQNGFITYNEDKQIIINPYLYKGYHEQLEDIYYLFDNNKYFNNFICEAQNYLDKYNIEIASYDEKSDRISVSY